MVCMILWKKEKPLPLLRIEPQCLSHPFWNPLYKDYARLKLLAYLHQLQVLLLRTENVYTHSHTHTRTYTHTHTYIHKYSEMKRDSSRHNSVGTCIV